MKQIDYQELIIDSVLFMVKEILTRLSQENLGDLHRFHITFNTTDPKAEISHKLKTQYPEVMKIALQYDYRYLVVEKDSFSVSLIFGQHEERLTIPFRAIRTFHDVSTNFKLDIVNIVDFNIDSLLKEDKKVENKNPNKKENNVLYFNDIFDNNTRE